MSKKLETIAKEVFKKYPKTQKVFVTSDGYPFFNENSAELHAKTNGEKALDVEVFERPKSNSTKTKKSFDEMNRKELETYAKSVNIPFKKEDTDEVLLTKIKEFKAPENRK